MEKAAKEITPAEEIKVATEEIVAEAKEEATEAPSMLLQRFYELIRERHSSTRRSNP